MCCLSRHQGGDRHLGVHGNTIDNIFLHCSPKPEAEPASSDEFDPVHLNVASKARLFMQLSKNNAPDSKKRCVRRKTLPVTSAEVREARANIIQERNKESEVPVQQDISSSASNGMHYNHIFPSLIVFFSQLSHEHILACRK